MKYKDLILKSKELLDEIKAPFIARKAEKTLELRIVEYEQKIAESEELVENEKSKNPIDFDSIINSLDQKDINKRRLSQLEELKKELF